MNERYRRMVKKKRESLPRYERLEDIPKVVLPTMSYDEATDLRAEKKLPPTSELEATPNEFFRTGEDKTS
mgnify:FL=1